MLSDSGSTAELFEQVVSWLKPRTRAWISGKSSNQGKAANVAKQQTCVKEQFSEHFDQVKSSQKKPEEL